jgi:protein SHQ1
MITPIFSLRQDDNTVTIELHCKYIKAVNVEMVIDQNSFYFHCKPYYLRYKTALCSLHFNASLTEDGTEKSSYNVDTGVITLQIPKLVPGEFFTDLDLLTTLMSKKPVVPASVGIQVLDSTDTKVDVCDPDSVPMDFDWNIEQTLPETPLVF